VTVLKWIVGIAGAGLWSAPTSTTWSGPWSSPDPTPPGLWPWRRAGFARPCTPVVGRISSFATRDHLLTTLEPIVMLRAPGHLVVGRSVGFRLRHLEHRECSPFGHSFIEAGSSIFTLGFATENHPAPEVVSFLAAAFGLLVVALQIAYLPALYDSFNRRETLVTMLESRAGTPAWGPGALARHYLVGIEGEPGAVLRRMGTLVGRRGREPHHLSGAALHALPPPHQLVARRAHRRPRLGRSVPGRVSGSSAGRGAPVCPDGIHLPARHRPGHPSPVRRRSPARRRHRVALRRLRGSASIVWPRPACPSNAMPRKRGPTSRVGASTTNRSPTP
jgi:hypothetical protein